MPKFELDWSMTGSAVIEADDQVEAEQILHEGLSGFDTSWFDEVNVNEASTDSVEEAK